MSKVTMKDRILKHLEENGNITSWEAIKEYGCTRLSASIWALREEGYNITTTYETNKNRYGDNISYGKYTLNK